MLAEVRKPLGPVWWSVFLASALLAAWGIEMCIRDRIDGREITIDCHGLLARCLQHECDHLNGILFVERVSSAQKITLRNKLKRLALGLSLIHI